MKKSVMMVSTMFIVFLLGSGLGYGIANPAQYRQRIVDLEDEIDDLSNRLSKVQTEKFSLGSELSTLKQQIETNDSQVSRLKREKECWSLKFFC